MSVDSSTNNENLLDFSLLTKRSKFRFPITLLIKAVHFVLPQDIFRTSLGFLTEARQALINSVKWSEILIAKFCSAIKAAILSSFCFIFLVDDGSNKFSVKFI